MKPLIEKEKITFPRYNELTGRALMRLLSGQRLNHVDFQKETGSYRLSSPIEKLRNKHHWPISDSWELVQVSETRTRTTQHKRYFISQTDIEELRLDLGERLTKFIEAVKRFEGSPVSSGKNQRGV
jgi:hypothetical protein